MALRATSAFPPIATVQRTTNRNLLAKPIPSDATTASEKPPVKFHRASVLANRSEPPIGHRWQPASFSAAAAYHPTTPGRPAVGGSCPSPGGSAPSFPRIAIGKRLVRPMPAGTQTAWHQAASKGQNRAV